MICILLIVAIVVGYALCYIVPYFQTFGRGYVFKYYLYSSYGVSVHPSDYPDHYLTLSGMFLNLSPSCIFNVIGRAPLAPLHFNNFFSGASWNHYEIDAKWLRQNSDAAWLGLRLFDGKIHWQYILKLNTGDIVVCYGNPLFTKGVNPFQIYHADYYSPKGTILDFYDHLAD